MNETGPANGLSYLLCAWCGISTLHRFNVCVHCKTVVIFPSEQRKVHLTVNEKKGLNALIEPWEKRSVRKRKLAPI